MLFTAPASFQLLCFRARHQLRHVHYHVNSCRLISHRVLLTLKVSWRKKTNCRADRDSAMATVTEVCIPCYLILLTLHWRLDWGPGYEMSRDKHRGSALILLHCRWRGRQRKKLPRMVNAAPRTIPVPGEKGTGLENY